MRRTSALPPQMRRRPRMAPLSQACGARPAMLAMARLSRRPSSGKTGNEPGGENRADAGHALQTGGPVCQWRVAVEMRRDLGLEACDPAAKHAQVRGDLFAEKRVSRLTEALRLGLAHADEVVAPGGQLGEAALGRVSRRRRPRRQRAAEFGQHLGIDPVGLGEPPARARELAGLAGVDPRIRGPRRRRARLRAAARSRQRLRKRRERPTPWPRSAAARVGSCRPARPRPSRAGGSRSSPWRCRRQRRPVAVSWSLSLICGVDRSDSRPRQLFRLGNKRRASPKLQHGLSDQGRGGVSPAPTIARTVATENQTRASLGIPCRDSGRKGDALRSSGGPPRCAALSRALFLRV